MKLPRPIHQFLSWFPHQEFAVLACAVFIVGLFSGKAIMSIGMMLLLGNALINLNVGEYFKAFVKDRTALLFVGLVFLYGLSFFWSEDTQYYLSRIQLMLPFLVLPFAFKSIQWQHRYFQWIMQLFIVMCVAGVTWSLYHYLIDKEAIDASYGFSKSMPTPFKGDHIRFGMAIVIGFSFVIYLLKQATRNAWQVLLVIAGAYFFIYLHLLASKTALLSLYLFVFYQLYLWLRSSKKWLLGLGLVVLIIVLPFIMYQLSSSFQHKVSYTRYSIEQLFNDQAQTNVSDEGRLVSYSTAFDITKEHVLLGVGVGDSYNEMERAYHNKGIVIEKVLLPHNQFLLMLLTLGIVGLAYFVFFVIYLFRKYFFKHNQLSGFLLLFVVPLSVEAFFETQYGIALFLFFFLFLKQQLENFGKETT